MINQLKRITALIVLLTACGPHVNTGRNSDPNKWPNPPATGEDAASDPTGLNSTCFATKSNSIPENIKKVCDGELRTTAEFKNLVPILCDDGMLISALDKPECGWDGQPSNSKNRYIHRYYIEKDTSKDYEDITSSIIHIPGTINALTNIMRLAFENFDEFKRRGYQWTSGTRENRNLSGTTWDQGVKYRFRADKEAYEVGYEGHIKFLQLTPTLAIHLNRATGDFERINHFAQILIYSQLPDSSSLAIRLENRKIASNGLFNLAKKGAVQLDMEAMEKGYSNATKK